jgi:hypothetical protein
MAKDKSSSLPLPEGEPIAVSSGPVPDPAFPGESPAPSDPPLLPAPSGESAPAAPAAPVIGEKDIASSSARQAAYHLACEHRRLFRDTLENGAFPLLPDKEGRIDTSRPVNAVSGYRYKGSTILILKAHQAACGFPTASYVAESHLEEANKRAGLHGTTIPNPHPVTISISGSDKPGADGKPAIKFIRLYNISEAAHPEAVHQLAKERAVEREQNFNQWQEKKAREAVALGETFEIRPFYTQKQRESNYAFKIVQGDPVQYLGQIFTAMALGTSNVKVTPYTAAAVKDNLVHYLYGKRTALSTREEFDNPFTIYSLGNAAGLLCKENLQKMFSRAERKDPEQPREQTRQLADMAMGM